MPTPTDYVYSIANDCPGGKVNTNKLSLAIQSSTIVTAIQNISTTGDVMTITFKDVLSGGDQNTLDGGTGGAHGTHPAGGLIASSDTSADSPMTVMQIADADGNIVHLGTDDGSGALKVAPTKISGTKINIYTHNFCDPRSWYQQSTKVTTVTLTDSGDSKTFTSIHTNWIDMRHGRISNEDNIVSHNSNKWVVTVTANGVSKTEDIDYTVNYAVGSLTFGSAQTAPVVATYWYAGSSKFTLNPGIGATYDLDFVEIQFSVNIVLNDTFIYNAWGYAGVFAPQYVPSIFQATDLIQLGDALFYKNAMDFQNDSDVIYPITPAFGGPQGPLPGGRGLVNDVLTLAWSYVTKTELIGNYGMQMTCQLANDNACTGEMGVATFYLIQS